MLSRSIRRFSAISLDDLNAKSALLDRQEHKYLIEAAALPGLLDQLSADYHILEIDGLRTFGYRSQYYDTDDLLGYKYHAQGRSKRRFKVRSRLYTDSNLCFFEVKLKNKRGSTLKKRFKYPIEHYGTITPEARAFFAEQFRTTYGEDFDYDLGPMVEVTYDRITLVAKGGGERLTIDLNLKFSNEEKTVKTKPMVIVETKTPNGYGIADALFRSMKVRSRPCSKYCLGANLLGYDVKYNMFKQLLKAYEALPEEKIISLPKPRVRVKPLIGAISTVGPARLAPVSSGDVHNVF